MMRVGKGQLRMFLAMEDPKVGGACRVWHGGGVWVSHLGARGAGYVR